MIDIQPYNLIANTVMKNNFSMFYAQQLRQRQAPQPMPMAQQPVTPPVCRGLTLCTLDEEGGVLGNVASGAISAQNDKAFMRVLRAEFA